MTEPKNHERDGLNRLDENLVDDILAASDEEIFAEAAEDYEQPELVVAATQKIFEKAAMIAAKSRLIAARAALEDDRQLNSKIVQLDAFQARKKLAQALAADPQMVEKFTLAARHGNSDQMSDEDVKGMLEDLDELGLLPDSDDGSG